MQKDQNIKPVSSGIYFAQLKAGKNIVSKKNAFFK